MTFTSPVNQIKFTLDHIVGMQRLADSGAFPDLSADLVDAVMTEAGRLSDEVLAPLNWSGDREGASLKDGVVTTPSGFKEAYQKFAEGGWAGLSYDPEYGG
ncbi:MAG: acyl-CoA dehydrogenase, partial [Pseudomonadota bacterium]